MTPLTQAHTELRLAVQRAEQRADTFLEHTPADEAATGKLDAGRLNDHRVDVAGDLAHALDMVEPGLGARFMQALYVELDLGHSDEWDALVAGGMLGLRNGQLHATGKQGSGAQQ